MRARFEASFTQYLVRLLGWVVVTIITLGVGGIWAAYDQIKWPIEHASLNDRQVAFTGTFVEFLGKLVIWVLVSIVTLGIGSVWVGYDATKWAVNHIEVDGERFSFNGTFTEYVGKVVIWFVVGLITFGFGSVWVAYDSLKWTVERSAFAAGTPVRFSGTFTDFIGKAVIWFVVTVITLGLGAIWVGWDAYRWLADRIVVSDLPIAAPPLPATT